MIEDGFGEIVRFACSRPHPRDLLAAMTDKSVVAIGIVDSESVRRKILQQYPQTGADELCLVPATATDREGARSLERL
jgi:hypothetical protein